jgi:hypothetical protein
MEKIMALTEEVRKKLRRGFEITDPILELKLGLFHVTHEFSFPGIDDILKEEIETDGGLLDDFILKKLNFLDAPRRFKSIELTEPAKNKKPDKKMNEYLIEALLCYLAGMFRACVVLCRTAIEIGIRDQINVPGSRKYERKNCDELIQEEEKHREKGRKERSLKDLIKKDLYDLLKRKGISENRRDELKELAHCIRIKGNIIAHSQENMEILDREKETLNVLLMTRDFLAKIYSMI